MLTLIEYCQIIDWMFGINCCELIKISSHAGADSKSGTGWFDPTDSTFALRVAANSPLGRNRLHRTGILGPSDRINPWRACHYPSAPGTIHRLFMLMTSYLNFYVWIKVNCLAAALQHAANKAMQVAAIDSALKRVRTLINRIQRTPELRVKIQERLTSQNLAVLPSILPRSASWFQVFTVLQRLQAGRECIQIVLTENREDVSALLPSQKDNYALEALQVFSRHYFNKTSKNHIYY